MKGRYKVVTIVDGEDSVADYYLDSIEELYLFASEVSKYSWVKEIDVFTAIGYICSFVDGEEVYDKSKML